MNRGFHFSIGPVQGFVAQSRRSRDLLASSFLLSYLAGYAMADVMAQGGQIVFPKVAEDPMMLAINQVMRNGKADKGPWIGSLPNRFKASVPDHFDPKQCEAAVHHAWEKIADAVWKKTVGNVKDCGFDTETIWNRQVKNWWEITWVMAEDPRFLDYRKYWRNYIPADEPGDKCTLLPRLQELSGYVRAKQRENQNKFWNKLREFLGKQYSLELQEKERLSAIGMIKRFFPHVAEEAIGWPWPDEAIHFPSVSYMAAHPGLMKALEVCPEKAESYAVEARKHKEIYPVPLGKHFPALQKKAKEAGAETLIRISANAFYPNELEQIESEKRRRHLQNRLADLTKEMGEPFGSYYALLLMDGDQLGNLLKHCAERGDEPKISDALSLFCDGLEELVREHEGVTIYAGGDDVMALFPMDRALPAAAALVQKYRNSFRHVFSGQQEIWEKATCSTSILFAHRKTPLKDILQEGHRLLDDVAKDGTGRDSLAVAVWKSSGVTLTWSAPWNTVIRDESGTTVMDEIIQTLQGEENGIFSGSFLYKLQSVYESMPSLGEQHREKVKRLITADYVRMTGINDKMSKEAMEERIGQLLQVCFATKRKGREIVVTDEFRADGALLAKFLAQKGIEE